MERSDDSNPKKTFTENQKSWISRAVKAVLRSPLGFIFGDSTTHTITPVSISRSPAKSTVHSLSTAETGSEKSPPQILEAAYADLCAFYVMHEIILLKFLENSRTSFNSNHTHSVDNPSDQPETAPTEGIKKIVADLQKKISTIALICNDQLQLTQKQTHRIEAMLTIKWEVDKKLTASKKTNSTYSDLGNGYILHDLVNSVFSSPASSPDPISDSSELSLQEDAQLPVHKKCHDTEVSTKHTHHI
ncbi:MAG: hypothetical protein V4490_02775 [Pseudomonadota bacterium]